MGYRGHVRTFSKIEYGSGMGGSIYEELVNFFHACDEIYPDLYCNVDDFNDRWEFDKESFTALLVSLKSAELDIRRKLGVIMNMNNAFATSGEAFEAALECIEVWIKECDSENGYVVVEWF